MSCMRTFRFAVERELECFTVREFCEKFGLNLTEEQMDATAIGAASYMFECGAINTDGVSPDGIFDREFPHDAISQGLIVVGVFSMDDVANMLVEKQKAIFKLVIDKKKTAA